MRGGRFATLRVLLFFLLLGLSQLFVFLPSVQAVQADPLDVWNQRTSGTESMINDIKYIDGKFIAVGQNGTVVTSPDGRNWTFEDIFGVMTAPEAVSVQPAEVGLPALNRIASGGDWIVVVGSGGTIVVANKNADSVEVVTTDSGRDLYGVTYNPANNTFVAVGTGGAIVTSSVTEFGTLSWIEQSWQTPVNLNRITNDGGVFVAVGDGGTVIASQDGSFWVQDTLYTTENLYRVMYANYNFFAVGANGAIAVGYPGAWSSLDPVTTQSLRGIAYGNGIYVAVGDGGIILTSPDGATWTARTAGDAAYSLRIAFGNGVFVAVGDGGVILTSTDGVTWTQRTAVTDATLRPGVYAEGTFVVAGSGGVILQSDPFVPQAKADIDYLYYWDGSGREIEYDFSEGSLVDGSIAIPDNAIWYKPEGDAAATYLWGAHAGTLSLNLDTAGGICTMAGSDGVAVFSADGAVAPASPDWWYKVVLQNFDVDLSLKQQFYTYSVGMGKGDSSGPRYRAGMEATWFSGWYDGDEYNKMLIVRTYIYDKVNDEDVWGEEYFVGEFPDPSKVSLDLYFEMEANKLYTWFYYNDGSGYKGSHDFSSAYLSEILPEGATIPSYPDLYPYVALETGNLIQASATSAHYGNAYYAHPMVYDEGYAISSVEVSGPGLEAPVFLSQNNWDDRFWRLDSDPLLGETPPAEPATYHFIITLQDGTVIEHDRTIQGYVEAFASNFKAAGNAGGQITLSWTGIPNATGYGVELHGAFGMIWSRYDLPSSTTSVVADEWLTLSEGETYYFVVISQVDSSGEGVPDISIVGGQFTYSAAVPSRIGTFRSGTRSGTWYLDNGNGVWDQGVDDVFKFGLATDIPVTGDWDGNGTKEIGVFRAGKWYLDMNGNGAWNPAVDAVHTFGLSTDIPVTGKWGGGATKIGVFRAGKWYLDMNGNGKWDAGVDAVYSFGLSTDTPVTGDWDGSGSTKIGTFRSGKWYLDNGNGVWDQGVDAVYTFGMAADKPVTGDWDGNGSTEIGVFRAGKWYLDNGSGKWEAGTDQVFTFGLGTDTPVVK